MMNSLTRPLVLVLLLRWLLLGAIVCPRQIQSPSASAR